MSVQLTHGACWFTVHTHTWEREREREREEVTGKRGSKEASNEHRGLPYRGWEFPSFSEAELFRSLGLEFREDALLKIEDKGPHTELDQHVCCMLRDIAARLYRRHRCSERRQAPLDNRTRPQLKRIFLRRRRPVCDTHEGVSALGVGHLLRSWRPHLRIEESLEAVALRNEVGAFAIDVARREPYDTWGVGPEAWMV